MKKETKFWLIAIIASFILGYCLVGSVFAGGVTDNNNGNEGNSAMCPHHFSSPWGKKARGRPG